MPPRKASGGRIPQGLANYMKAKKIQTGGAKTMTELKKHIVSQYGAGFWDNVKNFFKKIPTVAKNVLGVLPHPGAQVASKVLGAVGAGRKGVRRTTATYTTGGSRFGMPKKAPVLMGGGRYPNSRSTD